MTRLMLDRLRLSMKGTPLEHAFDDTVCFYNSDSIERIVSGDIEMEEFTTFAPPYKNFYVEMEIPRLDSSQPILEAARISQKQWFGGAWFVVHDYPEGDLRGAQLIDDKPYRWLFEVHISTLYGNTNMAHISRAVIALDAEGKPMPLMQDGEIGQSFLERKWVFYDNLGQVLALAGIDPETHLGMYDEFSTWILDAGMYTIGMLSCKNITTETVQPRAAENHKYVKRHGIPMMSYKILTISGRGASAGEHIGAPGQGSERALHWVRGHMRTFDESAPLFGKYTGTFYVSPHIRGKLRAGAVEKDYEVKSE